ncbi:MAG: hypothetical protein V2A65_05545 [Candidatus Omnitrophota bacterium]
MFEEDGRNLVNPKTTLGIDNEITVKSTPSREARLGINGKTFDVGLGESFKYKNHYVQRGKDILTLRVNLQPVSREFEGLILNIFYRIADTEVFIVKWVELVNKSRKEIEVTPCQPEVLTMPAPVSRWCEITRTVFPTYHPLNPEKHPFLFGRYDFSPEGNSPIIWIDHSSKRDETFGFTLTNDYVSYYQGASSIINPPTEKKPFSLYPGSIASLGQSTPQEVLTKYPAGPRVIVRPGEKFESFKTYMTLFKGDYEDGGLSIRKMVRKLCPWIDNFVTEFQHTYWKESVSKKIRETKKADLAPLKHTINQAAEVGFDYWQFASTLWISNFGDFEPRPEFPNGTRDMKAVADCAHSKGLKVGAYVMGECACDHWPTLYLTDDDGRCVSRDIGVHKDFVKDHPEYALKVPSGRKSYNVMCASGGWHKYRHEKTKRLVREIGLDAFDWDGNYYGDLCYSDEHKHSSPEESQYLNWRCQMETYNYYRDKGIRLMAPDFLQSVFHGNCGFPTYHTETATHKDLYRFILKLRECLYLSTFFIPNTALKYGVWVDENVMFHTKILKDPAFLDYYFASICAFGTNLFMLGEEVYNNNQTKNIIKKWLGFMKDYNELLRQDTIHLSCPTGNQIDAIVHIDGRGRGLLAAFNPTGTKLLTRLLIPGKYFPGLEELQIKDIWINHSQEICLNENNFPIDVEVNPKGYLFSLIC